jgi:hypothetical protein
LKNELDLAKSSISYLEKSNITKDAIIKEYKNKDSINVLIVSGYKDAIINLNKSVANAEVKFLAQSLKLKRQKIKKWGTLFLGVGIGYLVFNK